MNNLIFKPKPGHVLIQVIQCNDCRKLAVAIGDENGGTRLTRHKCSGAWTTILSESIDPQEIRDEVDACDRMRSQCLPDGDPPQADQ